MDPRIDEDKHPDRRAHETDARPHAQHRASMVVRLERRRALALCQNDEGIDDLVELADIEDPAPESQPFVPQSAHIRRIRVARRQEVDGRVLHLPDVDRRVVRRGVTESSRPMQLTQRVRDTCRAIRVVQSRPSARDRSCHGAKRREAVQSENDIVDDDEGAEGGGLADGPWLVFAAAVVRVEGEDGEDVAGREGERDSRAKREVVEVAVDAEGRADGLLVEGWRDGGRERVGDGLECRGPGQVGRRLILHHPGGVQCGKHASVA